MIDRNHNNMLLNKHLLLLVFKTVEYICSRFDEEKDQHLCVINIKPFIYIYIYLFILGGGNLIYQ